MTMKHSRAVAAVLGAAFIAALALPLYNIFFIYPSFQGQFLQSIEEDAGRAAAYLSSRVAGGVDLREGELPRELPRMIDEMKRDFRLWKLKLFSGAGVVVYSTDPADLGQENRHQYFRELVAKGRTHTVVVEKGGLNLEGDPIPLDVAETYVPIMRDGIFAGAFEMYYDVTARKRRFDGLINRYSLLLSAVAVISAACVVFLFRANQAVVAERDKWDATFDAIDDPIVILDRNYRFVRVNRAMAAKLGIPKERAAGLTCYETVHRKCEPTAACPHRRLLLDGQVHRDEVYEDALGGWYIIDVSPIRDARGAVTGSVHIAYDINERKRLENELREINAGLERRVREETALRLENERMVIQQSKMAAMGEMLGAIAHQWRQPLNALGLIIQDIRDAHEFGELDKAYLDGIIRKGLGQIQFMSKTIDDFRSFFRPDKEKQRFDVLRTAAEVVSMLAAMLKANQVDCRIACLGSDGTLVNVDNALYGGDLYIKGYPNELKQVFLNIINNAKDAIVDRKEKGLMRAGECGLISFEFEKREDRIVVRIRDNGGGVPAGILDRIFEPYFTTKEQGKGTGIGLYMSKIIVEKNMGGSLSARNIEDGAEFTIEL